MNRELYNIISTIVFMILGGLFIWGANYFTINQFIGFVFVCIFIYGGLVIRKGLIVKKQRESVRDDHKLNK